MTRPPRSCPKCGGPARPAFYRGERPPKKQAPFVRITGFLHCEECSRKGVLVPEKK